MEIICITREEKTYRPMFSSEDIAMSVAYVKFPEHGIVMGLSHRADDPDGLWLADSRTDHGLPNFVHGEGDRTCRKQIAGPEIVAAIEAFQD